LRTGFYRTRRNGEPTRRATERAPATDHQECGTSRVSRARASKLSYAPISQDKCTETIIELNQCLEVRARLFLSAGCPHVVCCIYLFIDSGATQQEIVRANEHVGVAAELATKYRKNVQYNLEATHAARAETGTEP
jgi:hypothetical protein